MLIKCILVLNDLARTLMSDIYFMTLMVSIALTHNHYLHLPRLNEYHYSNHLVFVLYNAYNEIWDKKVCILKCRPQIRSLNGLRTLWQFNGDDILGQILKFKPWV